MSVSLVEYHKIASPLRHVCQMSWIWSMPLIRASCWSRSVQTNTSIYTVSRPNVTIAQSALSPLYEGSNKPTSVALIQSVYSPGPSFIWG